MVPGHAHADGDLEYSHSRGAGAVDANAVIALLVGFDESGFRLGYGGGYFDRTRVRGLRPADDLPSGPRHTHELDRNRRLRACRSEQGVIDHRLDEWPGDRRMAKQHSKIAGGRQQVDQHIDMNVAVDFGSGNTALECTLY
jgi:hypothetical protein